LYSLPKIKAAQEALSPVGSGNGNSVLQEMGILVAEMAKRLRAGTSAIEFAIRRKNSEEDR
jgi:hypothetical protein